MMFYSDIETMSCQLGVSVNDLDRYVELLHVWFHVCVETCVCIYDLASTNRFLFMIDSNKLQIYL